MAMKEKSAKREDSRRAEIKHLGAMLGEAESRGAIEEDELQKLKVRVEFAKRRQQNK